MISFEIKSTSQIWNLNFKFKNRKDARKSLKRFKNEKMTLLLKNANKIFLFLFIITQIEFVTKEALHNKLWKIVQSASKSQP